jgi:hypothetical protein
MAHFLIILYTISNMSFPSGVKCKNIHVVEISFALREQVKNEIVISPID